MKRYPPKFSGSKKSFSPYQSIPEISSFGLVINPSSLISGEDLTEVNFPLIASKNKNKMEVLRPWGNLLLD